jgi:catechol 2,3-dioxygenase-like lactoylglutathione lyase family enzyme
MEGLMSHLAMVALVIATFQASSSLSAASEAARLDAFAGTWSATTSGASAGAVGEATYQWDARHRWLVYRSQFDEMPGIGEYEVNGAVGYDESARQYRAWAFSSAGVAIEYTGGWQGDTTLLFTSTTGAARVVYTILSPGSIRFAAERKTATGAFEPYFETLLQRRDQPPAATRGAVALRTVAYRVNRMSAMVAFYTEAFGARFQAVDARGIRSQFGEVAGLTLKFVPIRDTVDFENFPVHQLGFDVPDVEAVIALAVRHGGRVQDPPVREGGRIHASVRDPDGNTIELYAPIADR